LRQRSIQGWTPPAVTGWTETAAVLPVNVNTRIGQRQFQNESPDQPASSEAISEAISHTMTHILVTGANGFIARHLLQRHLLPWVDQGQCRLTLTDLSMPTRPLSGGLVDSQRAARVHCVQGDLANPQTWASLMAEPVDTIFHLAAMVSGAAEQHYEAGLRLNLLGSLTGLELCRQQHARGGAMVRFIYASSIAVYGPPLPGHIDDATALHPGLSYGAHKRMIEVMIDDMSRRQCLDGRGLRLSGVVVRPRGPHGALSGFNSDLLREPLTGNHFTCPVLPSACLWLSSAEVAVDQLWQLSQIPQALWTRTSAPNGARTATVFNAPAWPLRVSRLVAALGEIDPQAPARVQYDPAAPLQAQFGHWPESADFASAQTWALPSDRTRFKDDVVAFVRASLQSSLL